MRHGVARCLVFLAIVALCAAPAYAQTGSIAGKVTASDGSALPGVTVEARSNVLPTPRVVVTESNGEYRLPALQPGKYTVTFTLSGMQPVTREAEVQLGRETPLQITLDPKTVTETVTVTAESTIVDKKSPSLTNNLTADQFKQLPIAQDYRDLIKFLPAVAYTPDGTRGPSAGASGQDNVYKFDGINVTLPLYGTLSAEPASHDIAQVTVIRGGAQATQFDRAGGFSVDSISRSGTNRFGGQISYQFQNAGMTANTVNNTVSKYDAMHGWFDLSGGGPIIKDKAFFYASYYRPEISRANGSNLYGTLPDYDSTRNEGYVKLTVQPTHAILVNGSYRDSHRLDTSAGFDANAATTTGSGNESWLNIGTIDASWVINSLSFATMTWTHFINRTQGRPDNVSPATVSTALGTHLDIAHLDTQGLLNVPTPKSDPAQNAFVQPIISQYGYVQNGVAVGGGLNGVGTTFDKDDFFRDGIQFGYNYTWLMSSATHTLHGGYQWYVDTEELTRRTNGWGSITVPAGNTKFPVNVGTPIFYQAQFNQQTLGTVPTIHAEFRSQTFEFNDSIGWRNWNFNAGLLMSNDTLYGQGLRNDSSALSGFTAAPGNKYKMYDVPFSKMIQPRLGVTWAYDGTNTVFVSYAKYNPAANSLPRAASWDRNINAAINAYFDANGNLFATDPVASSTGKLFVPDMTPRTINEILFGTARQIGERWTGRLYGRYRKGTHYWEDTQNTARVTFNPPPDIPQVPYIANLADQLAQLGSTSSQASRQAAYVIADLDGAFTKYTEATVEAEYHGGNVFFRGSYTWSHYYGNFDQDGSSSTNDANIFIGSSNIGDGGGRQLWNLKTGDLHGDRPNVFKVYGSYVFNWHASAGAFLIAESGTPWEAWDRTVYQSLIGTSTSDTIRYSEPAGSRRTNGHFQLDLNYTQNIPLQHRLNAQIAFDLFNLGNSQTGYNIQQSTHNSLFAQPQNYWDPRRLQIAFRLQY
jgi:hypothetical protein